MRILRNNFIGTIVLLAAYQIPSASSVAEGVERKAQTEYAITERGANHRVWSRVTLETNGVGQIIARTNAYTELETGMHYLKKGRWVESKAEIQITADGAAATNGPHQVFFAANLNTTNAVDLVTPDGQCLRSHVLGLSYFDDATGQAVLIAATKDSVGQLFPPNQVIYPDAFDGVQADVQYIYTKAGFEQNIVLRTQPPSPAEYGLNPGSARLQVLTEFYDPPTPQKSTTTLGRNGLLDETLRFGQMKIGLGKAFAIEGKIRGKDALGVAKQWATLEGRTFLVEEIWLSRIEPQLKNLPEEPVAAISKIPVAKRQISQRSE